MINDSRRLGFKEEFDPDFVIGLLLDGRSRAYYYEDVAAVTLVNDWLDEFPVMVWAANQTFHAYLRQVEGQALTFQVRDGRLVDAETESIWDVSRGLAIGGPLQGQNLPPSHPQPPTIGPGKTFTPKPRFGNQPPTKTCLRNGRLAAARSPDCCYNGDLNHKRLCNEPHSR